MTSWKDNNVLGSRRLVEETLNSVEKSEKIVARNKKHLLKLIKDRIAKFGPNCDLNDIDVSNVKNMDNVFSGSEFNGDISQWDVSNVVNMSDMFADSPLRGKEPSWYRE